MNERNFTNATILVTGGAGFIGSNFVYLLRQRCQNAKIIVLDKLTYAGNLENLRHMERDPNYHFVRGDISSGRDVETLFDKFNIDCVVNFAAESHVDRSINDVSPFIITNIAGTANLMRVANSKWNVRPGKLFVHVSTDEVYGSLGPTGKFTETTPLAPKNPYSASKAASDMMVAAYVNTHDFPAVITRCSNNYGPYQFPEKLIPLATINIMNGKEIPVYGDGKQVRDWIYVEDHCDGIETVMRKGEIGAAYNFGGEAEMFNIDIIKELCSITEGAQAASDATRLITFVKDRPGHDRRYAMDITSARTRLDWSPRHNFKDALKKTVHWYIENKNWWTHIINGEYKEYYKKQYGEGR